VQQRVEVLEELKPARGKKDVLFYYRFTKGNPVINVRSAREVLGTREGMPGKIL
jgi:hypothetical protein